MTQNYQVEAVEPRLRITHEDFFNPRNRVTLVRVDDRKVLQVLMPIRRIPKRGDEIKLGDREVQTFLAEP